MAERTLTLRINVEGGQATTTFSGLNTSLLNLNNALSVAQASFTALNRALDIIGDVNELGQSVNIASETFTALAGGTQEAAAMLELLRQKTGGVADDLTLMGGASRLLQMGLADSKEEVAGLTEMAIKLGGALGMDATKAVEDFSLMLANVSFLRLDQFGISAGAVRARVDELKETMPELSREARFAMAVLERGQAAMDNLGDAADASSRAMIRLNTRFENIAQQGAANVNYALENMARLLEVILFEIPEGELALGEQIATGGVDLLTVARELNAAWNEMATGFNPEHIAMSTRSLEEFHQVLFEISALGAELGREPTLEEALAVSPGFENEMRFIYEHRLEMAQQIAEAEAQAANELNRMVLAQQNAVTLAERRVAAEREIANQAEREAAIRPFFERGRAELMYGGFTSGQYSGEDLAGMLEDYSVSASEADAFANMEGPQFGSQGQADYYAEQLGFARDNFEELQAMAEEFPDIISEDDIESAEEVLGIYEQMAQQAQAASDALQAASLSDLFGQQQGGRTGEMADDIIAQMEASGASEEEIAAARRVFDIGTGQETESSLAYQEDLVPIISEMAATDPQAALDAMQNFNDMMTLLAESGIDPNSVDAVSEFVDMMNRIADDPNIHGPGRGEDIGEGEVSAYESSDYEFNAQEFVAGLTDAQDPAIELASNFSSIKNDSEEFKDSMEIVATQSNLAMEHMDVIAQHLANMTGRPYDIQIIPRIDTHALHLALASELSWFQLNLR